MRGLVKRLKPVRKHSRRFCIETYFPCYVRSNNTETMSLTICRI